jgi:hypothetical protein
MRASNNKASPAETQLDLLSVSAADARDLLTAALVPDPKSGILRLKDQPCLIIRPEILVSIQKQLEQTVGESAKGIVYLSGERSAEPGLELFGALTSGPLKPLTLESARRIIGVGALVGWGRTEIVIFDPDAGRFALAIHNSPIALAYGPAKKPVCHFLAGWIAGIGRLLTGKELLCEESACLAQGLDRCEFELRPMPTA